MWPVCYLCSVVNSQNIICCENFMCDPALFCVEMTIMTLSACVVCFFYVLSVVCGLNVVCVLNFDCILNIVYVLNVVFILRVVCGLSALYGLSAVSDLSVVCDLLCRVILLTAQERIPHLTIVCILVSKQVPII